MDSIKLGKIYFVRHATSYFNLANEQWKATPSSLERKVINWDPQYIDTDLSEKGLAEAHAARSLADALEVDEVFVSPLRRALRTCKILFAGGRVPIRVCPLFSELCINAPDLSLFEDEPLAEFAEFDWSEMVGKPQYWLLDNFSNSHTERIRAEARTKAQTRELMLRTMEEIAPAVLEDEESEAQRIDRARDYLLAELNSGKNIAVVTHSFFIRDFTKRLFGESRFLSNCEIWLPPLAPNS